jgi:hypothetical protein
MASAIRIDQVVMYDITQLGRTTTAVPSDDGWLALYDTGEIAWSKVDTPSPTSARGLRIVERPGVGSWRTHASGIGVFELTEEDSARYRAGYSREQGRRYGTLRPTGPYPDLAIGLSFSGKAFAVEFTGRCRDKTAEVLPDLFGAIAIPIMVGTNRGRRDRAVAAWQFWGSHLKV